MVKVELRTDAGLALTTDEGHWVVTPINTVAWQLAIDHTPSKESAVEVITTIWDETDARKVFAIVPAVSEELIMLAKSIGFKQEGRMKGGCEFGDLVIIGRLR